MRLDLLPSISFWLRSTVSELASDAPFSSLLFMWSWVILIPTWLEVLLGRSFSSMEILDVTLLFCSNLIWLDCWDFSRSTPSTSLSSFYPLTTTYSPLICLRSTSFSRLLLDKIVFNLSLLLLELLARLIRSFCWEFWVGMRYSCDCNVFYLVSLSLWVFSDLKDSSEFSIIFKSPVDTRCCDKCGLYSIF